MSAAKDIQIPHHVIGESFSLSRYPTWRSRPKHHFLNERDQRAFNSRWAGKSAFTSSNGKGYKTTTLTYRGTKYRLLLSRVIFAFENGAWPNEHVDHINGNTLDNRWSNLRDATNSENMQNARISSANKSGITGVYWFKPRSCWTAVIGSNGRGISLGYYKSKDLAAAARKGAEKALGFSERHGSPK